MDAQVSGRLPPLSATRRVMVIAAIAFVGALWLFWRGPGVVIRGRTPLTESTPLWYVESAFVVLGFLVGDFVEEIRAGIRRRATVVLLIQLSILALISTLRSKEILPISCHATLCSLFLSRRSAYRFAQVRHLGRTELTFTVGLLLVVTWTTVVLWDDAATLVAGLVIGVFLGLAGAAEVFRLRPCLPR